jgi:CheY-like chemotaxis protein
MVASRRQADAALEGRRVLVVEDEVLVAMDLESELERCGCVVLGPAPTVARALALIDRERPDVAMLDLNLGGQPATPIVEALEAQGVPYVVVTGYGARGPELPDAPLLAKPVSYRQLIDVISQVLKAD